MDSKNPKGHAVVSGHAETTDSASHHMSVQFCAAHPEETVGRYLEKLRAAHVSVTAFPYIYVVDEKETLVGVLSLNAFLRTQHDRKISEIMKSPEIFVHPHTPRERVAMLALDHELKAIPVVDHEKRLLGIVSEKAIFKIFREEHVEDFLKVAGIHGKGGSVDVLRERVSRLVKTRFPWLIIGLIGGMIATWVMKFFEPTLERELALAFFIPVIVYMADAVGSQSQMLFIRRGLFGTFDARKYILREILVGFILAAILALLMFGFAFALFQKSAFAMVVGISLFITIIVAVIIAMTIPALLIKFKKDPAVGSGPFATVIRDILSIFIYFIIATIVL